MDVHLVLGIQRLLELATMSTHDVIGAGSFYRTHPVSRITLNYSSLD